MGTAASVVSILGCVAAIGIASAALLREPPAPALVAAPVPAVADDPRIPVLERRVAELTKEVETLRGATSASAAAGAPGDEHIKQVVQAELREQMNRFRQGMGGGGAWGQPQDPQALKDELAKEIQVDAAKAEQLHTLVEANRAAVRELFRSGQDREQLTAKMQEERQKLEEAAAGILSAEEQQRFTAWLQARQERRGRGGRGPGGQPGAAPTGDAPRGASF